MIVSTWTVVSRMVNCPHCMGGKTTSIDWNHELREYRKARGLSLRALAEKSGKTASYVWDLENGYRRMDQDRFQAMTGVQIIVVKEIHDGKD